MICHQIGKTTFIGEYDSYFMILHFKVSKESSTLPEEFYLLRKQKEQSLQFFIEPDCVYIYRFLFNLPFDFAEHAASK